MITEKIARLGSRLYPIIRGIMAETRAEQASRLAERLSEGARRVLALAGEEARGYGHPAVGAVHLLLALLQEEDSISTRVLHSAGVRLEAIRMVVGQVGARQRDSVVRDLDYSPRLRTMLNRAGDAARAAGAARIGTEHLLFGLADDEDSRATHTRERLRVDFVQVCERLLEATGLPTHIPPSGCRDVRGPSVVEGPNVLSPTALVRAAVEALHAQFYEPLSVADLLRDAWEGATGALMRANVSPVPPAPTYPDNLAETYRLHEEMFPGLEDFGRAALGAQELAAEAIREMLARRRDGHTNILATPLTPASQCTNSGARVDFGLIFTDAPPLAIAAVVPGGPAQRAGLRRGQQVLRINSQLCDRLRRSAAKTLLKDGDGATNVVTVRNADGSEITVELRGKPTPRISRHILPGPFGLLRIDWFEANHDETEELHAALTSFEKAGAQGWIIDLRWNRGGGSIYLSRLLVDQGRLFSRHRHNDAHLPDGTVLPRRVDIDADGTALPFQRPVAVLIGPESISGAESFAGPMRALGRATLVGERTAGACGAARAVALAPGWTISLAAWETRFGPEEWALNRIGVPPDVEVVPTADDDAVGRDPQLEAAMTVLRLGS